MQSDKFLREYSRLVQAHPKVKKPIQIPKKEKDEPSIIENLVAIAINTRLPCARPKRRRGKAARKAEERIRDMVWSRNPYDDSDFEEYEICESVWQSNHKHEDIEQNQLIFNIFRKDKIKKQKRLVNVTWAECVHDIPKNRERIKMFRQHAEPVLSKAPRKRRRPETDGKSKKKRVTWDY